LNFFSFFSRHISTEKVFKNILSAVLEYYPEITEKEEKQLKECLFFVEKEYPENFFRRHERSLILLPTQPDIPTLIACFLLNFRGEKELSLEEVKSKFGDSVSELLKGIQKISKISFQKKTNTDVIRRFLLSQVDNIRVLYLRSTQRIELLQRIKKKEIYLSPETLQKVLTGSIEIGAKLLAQLGMYDLKTQMEDLCFEIQNPEEFQQLQKKLTKTKEIREKYIHLAIEKLQNIFAEKNIEIVKIKGRNKGFFSVAQKIKRKDYASVDELNDVLALRIIVKDVASCYSVLSALHAQTQFLESHFVDYIAIPKENGYRSIHTSIEGLVPDNIPVEIQIRTVEMDHNAEIGSAAHWAYKQKEDTSGLNKDEVEVSDVSHLSVFEALKKKLPEKIYPMTPEGEVKELPVNATPIDFAYAIHSEIGDHCVGAKVNGKIHSLNKPITTFDTVEILTNKNKQPNPEWINFVVSDSARHKIQSFLNRKYLAENPEKISGTISQKISDNLVNALPVHPKKNVDEKTDDKNVELRTKKKEKGKSSKNKKSKISIDSDEIIIGGEKNMVYHFAQCCNPELPDSIVAYSSTNRDFVIHSLECKNLQHLRSLDPYRVVSAEWGGS
jgi:RelA/SpoT family (p)ppGpp synthetase